MRIYRNPIEKILDEQERDKIITNPNEPVRTFFRKIRYIVSGWRSKLAKIFRR
ncbi:MAG: hypothetical protein ACP5IL_08775 [Syntrophobacteraceae bacterium]